MVCNHKSVLAPTIGGQTTALLAHCTIAWAFTEDYCTTVSIVTGRKTDGYDLSHAIPVGWLRGSWKRWLTSKLTFCRNSVVCGSMSMVTFRSPTTAVMACRRASGGGGGTTVTLNGRQPSGRGSRRDAADGVPCCARLRPVRYAVSKHVVWAMRLIAIVR